MIMNQIIDKIKESSKIAISFHVSPDGDSLGSSLALFKGIRSLNKEVYIACKEKLPETFKFLPYSDETNEKNENIKPDTELVIILDCGNVQRIACNLELSDRKYTLINIDHHLSNDLYGDLNYVDTNSSAVGEIVYEMLRLMGVQIDKEIAACLYTSIVTDTGSFKHSNTTPVTHNIAGELLKTGVSFSDIHRYIFENKSVDQVKLYGKIIENMTLIKDNSVCVLELRKDVVEDLNPEAVDSSDIISIGTQLGSVEVAILIKEADEGVKISLRSKSRVDVRKIAEKFGGGGHMRASGLSLNSGIDEAKALIISAVEEELI